MARCICSPDRHPSFSLSLFLFVSQRWDMSQLCCFTADQTSAINPGLLRSGVSGDRQEGW